MCGICGELRLDGNNADLQIIDRMSASLAKRGPDHAGKYQDGPLAFGHRRLAVIDQSPRAHQPMVDSELKLVLVFNGTIYNYVELRNELINKGYKFFSDGDSEVIIKAYQEWGPSCVKYLQGMFAFAIWDQPEHTLFLARDRLGIKPLYWTRNSKRLRFASTMQALLTAGGVNTDLDAIAIHHQFTLHGVVPAPRTILKGIHKLEPGHWLWIHEDGTHRKNRYWRLIATRPPEPKSDQEWLDTVKMTLYKTVIAHHSRSSIPVGVLLSGGLDSSLLVGILRDSGVDTINTFSIGFEDQPEEQGNEFIYSNLLAREFATAHQQIVIPNSEVLRRLPEAVDAMSEPMFGQDAVAFYLLSEVVKREVSVVQSGQGADEVFGGYFWYQLMAAETQGKWIERLRQHYFDRDHAEYRQMITADYQVADYTSPLMEKLLLKPQAAEFMDALLRLDVTTLLVDDPVKRVDNMTMAHGLEARVPFLDHKLVELVATCPPELKLRAGGKYLLKTIARGMIPDVIIDRPKGYFPLPALKYVRGDFLTLMRDILTPAAVAKRNLYQSTYIDMLFAAPDQHHTRILGSKLWHCALLEYWLQRHIS